MTTRPSEGSESDGQTPSEEIHQLRSENARMRLVLEQSYEAMARVVELEPFSCDLARALEAIDLVLRRE